MNVNGPKMCNLHISPSSPPSTQIFILLLVGDALKFYRAMDKKKKKGFLKELTGLLGSTTSPHLSVYTAVRILLAELGRVPLPHSALYGKGDISSLFISFFFSLKELNLFQREYRTSCMPVQFFSPPSAYHLLTCVNRRRGGGVGREFSCYCGRPCQLHNLLKGFG
jgi:hypothetical protein